MFACFWQLQLLIHQVACTQVAPHIHSSWADIAGTGWKDLLKISNGFGENFGRIWSQLKLDLATIWKGFGDNFERNWWQFWRDLGRNLIKFGDYLKGIWWQFWKYLVTFQSGFGGNFTTWWHCSLDCWVQDWVPGCHQAGEDLPSLKTYIKSYKVKKKNQSKIGCFLVKPELLLNACPALPAIRPPPSLNRGLKNHPWKEG